MRTPPFPMRCTIARHSGRRDTYGQPEPPSTVAALVACYWWAGENAWAVDVGEGRTAVEQEHVLFAIGTNIRPGDWITALVDHAGRAVFGPEAVRVVYGVLVMRNHLDCTLRTGHDIGGRS